MKKLLLLLAFNCAFIALNAQQGAVQGTDRFDFYRTAGKGKWSIDSIVQYAQRTLTFPTTGLNSLTITTPTGMLVNGGQTQTLTANGAFPLTFGGSANQPAKSNGSGGLTYSAIDLASATQVTGLLANANLANSLINHTVGTSGNDVLFSASSTSLGGTMTLNVPDASSSARGVMNTGNQSVGSAGTTKTFNGSLSVSQLFTQNGAYSEATNSDVTGTTYTFDGAESDIPFALGASNCVATIANTIPANRIIKVTFKSSSGGAVVLTASAGQTVNGQSTYTLFPSLVTTGTSEVHIKRVGTDWKVN